MTNHISMTRQQFRRRLQNLGMKFRDAVAVSKWYDKNLTSRGAVGAIDYFKRVGETLHAAVTGVGSPQPWVSVYGPRKFPRIFKHMSEKYPDAFWLRLSKFARTIQFKELQQTQVDKVYSAVITPYQGNPDILDTVDSLVTAGVQSFPRKSSRFGRPPLVTKQFRRVTSYSGTTPTVSEPPVLESLHLMAQNPIFQRLPWWKEVFYPLHSGSLAQLIHGVSSSKIESPHTSVKPNIVGFYSYTQEGAGKCRAYASPFAVIQCLLDPIKDYLSDILRPLKTDCTYDQESGALWAQKLLREGVTLHSVDLSTATCRFPLRPQLKLLSLLGIPGDIIAVLEFVCRAEWLVHKDFKKFNVQDTLAWSVGQPLGISPSIRMFSLVHNALLAGICKELGRQPKACYRVLGDDVVISDCAVTTRYKTVLSLMGVPISYHKSWSSDSFAEFAGYQIVKSDMVRPGQWSVATPLNLLGLSDHLGIPLNSEVSSKHLLAQKISLFRSGKYYPPKEHLSIFLKASYLLDGWNEFLNWEPNYIYDEPVFWYWKVRSIIVDQLSPYFKKPQIRFDRSPLPQQLEFWLEIGRKLPRVTNLDEMVKPVSGTCIGIMLLSAYDAVWSSDLTLDEKKLSFELVLSTLKSYVWAPPKSQSREVKDTTQKILSSVNKARTFERLVAQDLPIGLSCDTSMFDTYQAAIEMGCDESVIWSLCDYDPYGSLPLAEFLHSVGAR